MILVLELQSTHRPYSLTCVPLLLVVSSFSVFLDIVLDLHFTQYASCVLLNTFPIQLNNFISSPYWSGILCNTSFARAIIPATHPTDISVSPTRSASMLIIPSRHSARNICGLTFPKKSCIFIFCCPAPCSSVVTKFTRTHRYKSSSPTCQNS